MPYRPARMVRPWERFLPGMFFTGSHGVAPPFTPNLIPGLLLWLRGDLGVTLNGSNVSAWADQSGNLNNFTQATAIRQPPTNTVINGKPCVVFDGTTAMTAVNFIGVGAKTIVLIRKYALSTGINQALLLLMSGTTVNKVNYVSTDVSATYQPLQFFCDWTASIAGRKTVPAMDASPHMDFMDYNGGTNNVNASYDAWIDGTSSVISNGGTFGGEVLSNLTSIGQNVNSSGALVSPAVVTACSVAEVLVWGRQLTSTERNKLGGYVQTRYAITIAGATF